MVKNADRVLVVGPSWVGDMVMSQVLYRLLQQTRPGVIIDVLAPAWSGPILARMPEVNSALTKPIGHGEPALGRRWKIGRALRAEGYSQAILLPNSFKSALIPFFAGIPRRTGWRGEMRYGLLNDLRNLDAQALPLMVQQFAALGLDESAALPTELPAPRLIVDAGQALLCQQQFGLATDRPLLALCPGAEFGSAKRWPLEYYAEVAKNYMQRGWQVALFGSDKDRQVTADIALIVNDSANCFDLAGKTQLAQAVDMLSLADAVVSNDSGLMHIAAALSRPLVVVYGATSPGFTPPLNANSSVLVSDIDCAPCFQRECPLGHHRCMRDTPAALVTAKLDALLASNSGK
ncbi:lipopolysaccharide heptosyltransferase II [Pseudohalioglobus lutimaris]|uniref:lipopolysaccharide heptosyltransferase II n=1 Tax=Pseudohalioglobus lutimaris TaxID=1737061 RepID=A0A2N5X8L7_9GAMM|nr:lipopolysaccharide heptosyltransferase II [Pseudohalioglobus lutimaris]PLW70833.1 lipopolysaccharide heptosyltransferase II [Pseudohalioglobus lutimaris]